MVRNLSCFYFAELLFADIHRLAARIYKLESVKLAGVETSKVFFPGGLALQ